ncbi:MAG: hypothetical protein UT48_C0004G0002 [Parcubacteria group bacterium GW2011_GWE2_39_37]|nr:MAG: hypothetical protein UT48_C0004G0002 [Parcubacteria group bacterium GW2011_GWE2_39_37]
MKLKNMNWKKIIIIVAILFLIGTIIRIALYFQIKSTANEFSKFATDSRDRSREAAIRVIGSTIVIGLEDWKIKHGDYSNFIEGVDISKLTPSLAGKIKSAEVEYEVFTTKQNYVIKIKPSNQKIIYCFDPSVSDLKIISFDGTNFNSPTDCNGINIE